LLGSKQLYRYLAVAIVNHLKNTTMEEEKSFFDKMKDKAEELAEGFERTMDKLEDAAERKLDELKANEKVAPYIQKGEALWEKLEDKAEELKDKLLGDDDKKEEEVKKDTPPA
jgi:predicted ribosome quality control (RQC) complex YloA/Tae2 family protein